MVSNDTTKSNDALGIGRPVHDVGTKRTRVPWP